MKEIDRMIELILKEADERENSAGMSGRYDDGGAGRLRDQVAFYKMGMEGTIPSEWREYLIKAKRESDPEFGEYVRLKNKFERMI